MLPSEAVNSFEYTWRLLILGVTSKQQVTFHFGKKPIKENFFNVGNFYFNIFCLKTVLPSFGKEIKISRLGSFNVSYEYYIFTSI